MKKIVQPAGRRKPQFQGHCANCKQLTFDARAHRLLTVYAEIEDLQKRMSAAEFDVLLLETTRVCGFADEWEAYEVLLDSEAFGQEFLPARNSA